MSLAPANPSIPSALASHEVQLRVVDEVHVSQRKTQPSSRSRGAVMVEYAFLLVAFALPVMLGLVIGGVRMLDGYTRTRDQMLSPFP